MKDRNNDCEKRKSENIQISIRNARGHLNVCFLYCKYSGSQSVIAHKESGIPQVLQHSNLSCQISQLSPNYRPKYFPMAIKIFKFQVETNLLKIKFQTLNCMTHMSKKNLYFQIS